MGNLSAVGAVLHHKHVKFGDVVHEELVESVRKHVSSFLVGAVSNVWHRNLSTPLTTDTRVNTFRTAP